MSTPPLEVVKGGDSRRRQTRLALFMIGGVAALGCMAFIVLGLFIFPSMRPSRDSVNIESTRTNMMIISQGLRSYADAHNGQFPKGAHWMSDIEPYLGNPRALQAPGHSVVASTMGYTLNQEAAGAKWDDSWTKDRVLIFEQLEAPPSATGDPQKDAEPRGEFFPVVLGDGTLSVVTKEELAQLR